MEDNNNRSYYAIIPATVRYDKSIVANAKLLYGEITALCNDKGFCWASNNYFADLYNVTKNTISTWISSLVKAGYLRVQLIYKENSKEIQQRNIYISEVYPITNNNDTPIENSIYPITKNRDVNTKTINTKIEYTSKDVAKTKPIPLLDTKKSNSKAKDIVTMRSMISAFTDNEDIQHKLLDYFNIRLKKGLQPNQWKIILEDLRQFAGDESKIALDKINGAIAGGYMQIIASWEKDKKNTYNKPKFDNTANKTTDKAVVNMSEKEQEEFIDTLATDEQGNLLTF